MAVSVAEPLAAELALKSSLLKHSTTQAKEASYKLS